VEVTTITIQCQTFEASRASKCQTLSTVDCTTVWQSECQTAYDTRHQDWQFAEL